MKVRIIFLSLLTIVGAGSSVARPQEELKPVLGVANKCEEAKALLDLLCNEAGDESIIILVARPGDGEAARKVNRQRPYAVWSYLHHAGRFPGNRLVKAEGEKVRGRGRVELYAKGKLMLVIRPAQNADAVGEKSCGPV